MRPLIVDVARRAGALPVILRPGLVQRGIGRASAGTSQTLHAGELFQPVIRARVERSTSMCSEICAMNGRNSARFSPSR